MAHTIGVKTTLFLEWMGERMHAGMWLRSLGWAQREISTAPSLITFRWNTTISLSCGTNWVYPGCERCIVPRGVVGKCPIYSYRTLLHDFKHCHRLVEQKVRNTIRRLSGGICHRFCSLLQKNVKKLGQGFCKLHGAVVRKS